MSILMKIGVLFFALYFTFTGFFKYGMWASGGPAGGFLPTVIGSIMVVLCIYDLFSYEAIKICFSNVKKFMIFIVGVIVLLVLMSYLGFYIVALIGLFSWLFWMEHFSLKKVLLCEGCVLGAIYLIFSLWLRIPFPSLFFLQ